MGNTLPAKRTIGCVNGLIACHIHRSAGTRILNIPHMHILYLVTDLYTAHTFDTFSRITYQREGRIPRHLGHLLLKRNLQNPQIIGYLLQIAIAASDAGGTMAVVL